MFATRLTGISHPTSDHFSHCFQEPKSHDTFNHGGLCFITPLDEFIRSKAEIESMLKERAAQQEKK